MQGTPQIRPLVVNGLTLDVTPDYRVMDDVLVPALERVASRHLGERRTFVFLVAPPATGKSVLAALLADHASHLDVDAVGIDGFHYPQARLDETYIDTDTGHQPLARFKGAPETFDTAALDRCLEQSRADEVRWPEYDRLAHDVVPQAHLVTASLVIVEGNWLLLDDHRWAPLARHSAFNVFVDAHPALLRDRLIDRKVRGGATQAQAEEFFERSDRLNVERVLEHTDRSQVDLTLRLHPDGSIQLGGNSS